MALDFLFFPLNINISWCFNKFCRTTNAQWEASFGGYPCEMEHEESTWEIVFLKLNSSLAAMGKYTSSRNAWVLLNKANDKGKPRNSQGMETLSNIKSHASITCGYQLWGLFPSAFLLSVENVHRESTYQEISRHFPSRGDQTFQNLTAFLRCLWE